jgi:hypothetical protein
MKHPLSLPKQKEKTMTKQQFDKAVELARSKIDLSMHDDSVLDGCGLPCFKPATVTLEAAARFIR